MLSAVTISAVVVLTLLIACGAASAAAPTTALSPPPGVTFEKTAGEPGLVTYTVTSPYQRGPNAVEVLLPDAFDPSGATRYRVVYVLPVNTGTGGRWGHALLEIKRLNLHNRYAAIFVMPAYDTEPWFGDHPIDPTVRQQAYLTDAVIPLIDRTYPTADAAGRFLIGFSKSGWGGLSLFLRNPTLFEQVAVFDPFGGPMTDEMFTKWGIAASYGTRENLDRFDPHVLIERRGKELGPKRRIVLMAGGPGSRIGVDVLHAKLRDAKVPYTYVLGSDMAHDWTSGWLPLAVAGILSEP